MTKQIDSIYQAYTARIIKYLSSTEFYNQFMSVIESGKNTFQFSNRKVEKHIDEAWVTAIEDVIKPMEEIIANPRNFIAQEEVVVNIALAKKVTPASVRHLAQHGNMIDTIEDGNVRPNKLMNNFKEDTLNTYENRFVYTLLEMVWEFVSKRYEAIFAAMSEEYGAFLKMEADMRTYYEHISANIDIRIRQEEDLIKTDEKNETIFARIARLHRLLGSFRQTGFAKEVAKYGKIKPPLVKTNVISKNPNFKACHRLWNFLTMYEQIGYNITISEQSSKIDEGFIRDIYHSILFNYIILKNYLENPKDREIHVSKNVKKTKIKPKFITQIVEEFVKNYDLPDVVVRKVLIEEITKAQLMLEEEEERQRLVAEKEKEMLEKKRQEEQERQRQLREAERERQRLERELKAEQERQRKEIEKREKEENRKALAFKAELERFQAIRASAAELIKKEEEAAARRLKKANEPIENEKKPTAKKTVKKAATVKEETIKEAALQKNEPKKQLKEKNLTEKKEAAEQGKTTRSRSVLTEKEKQALEKAKLAEKEKAAKEKAKAKEKAAKERAKAKEKAAKEKAKLAEKEKLAKERARLAEKEKAAKDKAKVAEKGKTAAKTTKAKSDASKTAAPPAETVKHIAKQEPLLNENAADTQKPASSAAKKLTSEEAALKAFLGDVEALKKSYIKEAVSVGSITDKELEILKSEAEITADLYEDSSEEAIRAAEELISSEIIKAEPAESSVDKEEEQAPMPEPAADVNAIAVDHEPITENEKTAETADNKAELFKEAVKSGEERAVGEADKLKSEEKQQKKKGLGKVLSNLFRNQG